MFCLAVPRVGELFVPEQGSTMFIVELVSHRAKTVHGIQSSRPFVYLRDTAANEMISSLLKEL
jgi:hypothetical protein